MNNPYLKCTLLLAMGMTVLFQAQALADTPERFAACAKAFGEEYQTARNALLADPDLDKAFLEGQLQSDDWRNQVLASSLLGWIEHGDKYRALLAQEPRPDQAGRRHYPWVGDAEALNASVVPLLYEMLFRGVGGEAGKDAALKSLPYLARGENGPNLSYLTAAVEDRSLDKGIREASAITLSMAPAQSVEADKLLAMLKAEVTREQPSKAVAGSLMDGILARSDTLEFQEKNQMVDALAQLPKLQDVVGYDQVVYTAGGIGGPQSVTLVASFLKQAKSDADKHWAVSTLADSGTTEGTKQLLDLIEKEQADSGLRLAAIESLGRAIYTPAVGESLGELLENEQGKSIERRTALASLAKQYKKPTLKQEEQKSIQQKVKSLKTNDQTLEKELEQFRKRLDANPR